MPFVLLYWKEIVIALAVAVLIGFGVYIRGVIADNDKLKVSLKQANAQVVDVSNMNKGLTTAVDAKTKELQNYIALNSRLTKDKAAIQDKYITYMERVRDGKIEVKPGVGIVKPIVLIGAGVPTFSSYSTGSYHP